MRLCDDFGVLLATRTSRRACNIKKLQTRNHLVLAHQRSVGLKLKMKISRRCKQLCCIALLVFALGTAADAHIRSFPIPSGSQPISIIQGPDGNFWFTLQNSSQIGRITPHGVITEFRTPTFSFPSGITAGPDGNVWFCEGATGQIGFITPAGRITEIRFSSFDVSSGITTGPDGNIWFTDVTGNNIWRVDLITHQLTMFPVPTPGAFPNDITTAADGNLWFTESIGKIGRITPDGVITEFGDNLGGVYSIAGGPDGNVWFTVRFTPQVGRITPTGQIDFFRTPNNPEQITRGHGNTLYFSEFGASRIARITTDGIVTESRQIRSSQPTGITAGVNRSVWFLGYADTTVYTATFE
jgi:streptogramin lyase